MERYSSVANTVLTKSGIGEERGLARIAQRMAAWTEKWFPDAYIFALAGVIIVAVAALVNGASPQSIADTFGDGFWDLTAFTLQMAMVVLTGYVVATSPPVARLINRLALIPPPPARAVSFVALLSMSVSFLNWGLSLVFGGLLARAIARRKDLTRGLPRARRRGLHGPRRRLGARPVLLGGAAAGHRGLAAAGAAEDHRHPGLRHHDLHLAVAAHRWPS